MTRFAEKTKITALFVLTAVLTLALAGCSKEEAPSPEEVDLTQAVDLFEQPVKDNPLALAPEDVVVTVAGKDITHGEVMQGVQMTLMQMSRQVPPQQLQQMAGQIYKNVSDTLIANILLTQAAETSSLAVSDDELAAEIAQIEANAPDGMTLQDALKENEIDFDEWKQNLREQMLVRKLVEEKTADVPEAAAVDVASFYEENVDSFKVPETVTASHILLAFTPEDTDETKAEKKDDLAQIRDQIAAGASFEELAAEKSDCPSSQRGGALGTFTRGQMVAEFDEVAFTLEPGALSDIVETQFGYHLIKVTDHQMAGVRSLSEVKDQLQQYLTGQKKQEALLAYIEELKEKSDVTYHKQDLDAAAETE